MGVRACVARWGPCRYSDVGRSCYAGAGLLPPARASAIPLLATSLCPPPFCCCFLVLSFRFVELSDHLPPALLVLRPLQVMVVGLMIVTLLTMLLTFPSLVAMATSSLVLAWLPYWMSGKGRETWGTMWTGECGVLFSIKKGAFSTTLSRSRGV